VIQRLQKPPCRPQGVRFQRLTHRWMCQGRKFPAHVESAPYDTPTTVRQSFCENFENKFTLVMFEMSLFLLISENLFSDFYDDLTRKGLENMS